MSTIQSDLLRKVYELLWSLYQQTENILLVTVIILHMQALLSSLIVLMIFECLQDTFMVNAEGIC